MFSFKKNPKKKNPKKTKLYLLWSMDTFHLGHFIKNKK